MENKTIKIYNYEDENAKTQITINSFFKSHGNDNRVYGSWLFCS